MSKPKCEDVDFEHAWEDVTPDFVYATFPPTYPPKQRRCRNCGLVQQEEIVQREIRKWTEKS